MKICLLITNYNGLQYLSAYLPAISAVCKKHNIRLIVSDNISNDGSVEYLAAGGFEYTVCKAPNRGFAGNINNAFRYAMSVDDFDYFVVSNNDIEVADGLFDVLGTAIQAIQRIDPDNGFIGFDEILRDRKGYFDAFDYQAYDPSSIRKVKEVPGFFMIIRKKVVDTIGFFDEEYFMYGEDNDFFARATKAGFTMYNTLLPVLHYSEGSSTSSKKTSWYVYRNAFLYAQKNHGISGVVKMLGSFLNQIYNPFFKNRNAGNLRVTRNGFFYNNYLLAKSLVWNLRYYIRKTLSAK